MEEQNNKIRKTEKKSNMVAQEFFEYQNLSNPQPYAIPCSIEENGEEVVLTYDITGLKNIAELKNQPLEYQYQFLINIEKLESLFRQFSFPFEEENCYFNENMLPYICFRDVRNEYEKDLEAAFLREYQYLTAGILNKKYTWKQIRDSGLEIVEKDKYIMQIRDCKTAEDLAELLRSKKEEFIKKIQETKIRVDKKKYQRNHIIFRISLALFVIVLFYTGYQNLFVIPMQRAIMSASKSFVTQNYVSCIDDLENVDIDQMDSYTKYILAVSYTKAENFDQEEMKNIAEKVSISSNEKELEYWISIGRLDIAQAQNIAKALSDDKLLIYAYLKEINMLENNTAMDGTKKQERLNELNQEMDALGEQYLDQEGSSNE